MWWLIAIGVAVLAGCSSSSTQKQAQPAPAAPRSSNPVARSIELVGLRVSEKSAGHLQVQFGVVNHSEADIGDVKMDVNLRTTTAKPGDPPLITFSAKVPSLGPSELKQVTADVPTKMRAYELPDWQFLKADFQLAEP
jgi:hypothetical protein